MLLVGSRFHGYNFTLVLGKEAISDGQLMWKAITFPENDHLGLRLAYSVNTERTLTKNSVSRFWLKTPPLQWGGGLAIAFKAPPPQLPNLGVSVDWVKILFASSCFYGQSFTPF